MNGYQCAVCHQWVPAGAMHVCGGTATSSWPVQLAPSPHELRVAAALERIAAALEKLAEREPNSVGVRVDVADVAAITDEVIKRLRREQRRNGRLL